ncbi:hypothetical protein A8C56_00575 [Niabella ginsenosidivorans]|uniref:Outer membrane protein beta-barrel domain-containing protein n=1 Tax=Niabella ginsenosidivorans TaxID=1176587 RepID=A0A1A9HW84_9BACT|nr:hypothetical protein [Niabella ginsenosidivorans]ANH79668.1 hypothetical protein A8C56_00575 [Niabella ginsenosidivorans]
MRKITFFAVFIALSMLTYAQTSYKQAIGMRLSSNTSYEAVAASYKFFVAQPGAIELNLGFGNRDYWYNGDRRHAPGVSFAGTYQHHFAIKPVPGLKWFVGGGLVFFNTSAKVGRYDGFGAGIYPTGGIDYKFPKIPLNLSADVRPVIHFTAPDDYDTFHPTAGIAARYTF